VIPYAKHDGAQLVSGSHIYPVELAMSGNGVQVDHSGRVHHGQTRCGKSARQASQPFQATGFVRGGEEREPEVGIGRLGRSLEWQAIARRPGDEVRDTRFGEQLNQAAGIGQGRVARPAAVEIQPAVGDPADVDAHRARVDADDSGHG
jgi:hypothetical protein